MKDDELRDCVAKAIADAAGHGMREKCLLMADAAIEVMAALYSESRDKENCK